MAKNSSIMCTISQCANHACPDNYCSLQAIRVGTHETNPTKPECTDCQSFVLKS